VRLLVVLSVVATLAFAAAGCGGGGGGDSSVSGTKPETWAASVCTALQTWGNDLESGSRKLRSSITRSADLPSVKKKLITFLRNGETSTEKLVADVKAAGAPAVENGPAMQSDLRASLDGARGTFQRAVAKAKKLPTNDPRALAVGLTSLGTEIRSELTSTGARVSSLKKKYDSSELNKAMADEPACKPFVSSS
jgi:hypothetical protein